jgi:hypothetical protein
MCWKQEWAMAINNLQHAIEHVAKARDKLVKRLGRNEKHFDHLMGSKKHRGDKAALAEVQGHIQKNRRGIADCDLVMSGLRTKQDLLFAMIQVYGLNRSENPKRVKQLMGKYVPKEAET